jgi:ketosteroid isomerase-like protein
MDIGGRVAESQTRELLTSLVGALGDADRVCGLLAPDAQWWITPTVGVLASPTVGRDAIYESMRTIFGELYADVRTSVHHTLVDNEMGAARFTLSATALFADGRPYENEYTMWVRTDGGAIVRVWEYLDVAHSLGQFGLSMP